MIRLLLYIKHHLSFLWEIIESLNGKLFSIFHSQRIYRVLPGVLKEYGLSEFIFRLLNPGDLPELRSLLEKQPPGRLEFFKPHALDEKALQKVFNNPSFLMMGAFKGPHLVGYFFLRCFWNKKCFVGRLIDEPFQGKGIGRTMNDIMYNTAWKADFRVFSTISKNNLSVMRSHANNPSMVVLKELKNDYLFVEFIKQKSVIEEVV